MRVLLAVALLVTAWGYDSMRQQRDELAATVREQAKACVKHARRLPTYAPAASRGAGR